MIKNRYEVTKTDVIETLQKRLKVNDVVKYIFTNGNKVFIDTFVVIPDKK